PCPRPTLAVPGDSRLRVCQNHDRRPSVGALPEDVEIIHPQLEPLTHCQLERRPREERRDDRRIKAVVFVDRHARDQVESGQHMEQVVDEGGWYRRNDEAPRSEKTFASATPRWELQRVY